MIDDDDDKPAVAAHVTPPSHDWHFAIGPYLWASSVNAKVSLGGASTSAGVSFFQISDHAKFGVPVLAEASYKRLSLAIDLEYGVIGIDGSKDLGPVMATLDGNASSLSVDALAGYRLVGNDHSTFAVDVRAGVRYGRTVVAGSLAADGATVISAGTVETDAAALAGARAFARPLSWLWVSANADVGLFGSTSTWSAEAEADFRVTHHVMISAGYRTLTTDSAGVQLTMYGPRAAVQATF